MADLSCSFTIPTNGAPGKLTGGFLNGNTLSNPGNLIVSVLHPNVQIAPGTLTGVFVFTTSPLGNSDQTTPSPFVMGPNSNFQCITTLQATGSTTPNGKLYVFSGISYPGNLQGDYELTFVAVNNEVSPPVQWSEDPEFDTSN